MLSGKPQGRRRPLYKLARESIPPPQLPSVSFNVHLLSNNAPLRPPAGVPTCFRLCPTKHGKAQIASLHVANQPQHAVRLFLTSLTCTCSVSSVNLIMLEQQQRVYTNIIYATQGYRRCSPFLSNVDLARDTHIKNVASCTIRIAFWHR